MAYEEGSYLDDYKEVYGTVVNAALDGTVTGENSITERLFKLIDDSDTSDNEKLSMKKDAYMQIIASVTTSSQKVATGMIRDKYTLETAIKKAEKDLEVKSAQVVGMEEDNKVKAQQVLKSRADVAIAERQVFKIENEAKLVDEQVTSMQKKNEKTDVDILISKKQLEVITKDVEVKTAQISKLAEDEALVVAQKLEQVADTTRRTAWSAQDLRVKQAGINQQVRATAKLEVDIEVAKDENARRAAANVKDLVLKDRQIVVTEAQIGQIKEDTVLKTKQGNAATANAAAATANAAANTSATTAEIARQDTLADSQVTKLAADTTYTNTQATELTAQVKHNRVIKAMQANGSMLGTLGSAGVIAPQYMWSSFFSTQKWLTDETTETIDITTDADTTPLFDHLKDSDGKITKDRWDTLFEDIDTEEDDSNEITTTEWETYMSAHNLALNGFASVS